LKILQNVLKNLRRFFKITAVIFKHLPEVLQDHGGHLQAPPE
jgi:hypothetical protein